MNQRGKMEDCRRGFFFTRVGQHRNNRLHAADLWFRGLEQIVNVAASTMDGTDPRGESDLFTLAGSVFVDVRDMVWAVGTMKIDDVRCS